MKLAHRVLPLSQYVLSSRPLHIRPITSIAPCTALCHQFSTSANPVLIDSLLHRCSARKQKFIRCWKTFSSSSSRFLISPNLHCRVMHYSTEVRGGEEGSENYRLFFKNEQGQFISPMHDIDLEMKTETTEEGVTNGNTDGQKQNSIEDSNNRVFNMITEIPRWSNAKMEISLSETMNPIKQDVKKGKLRYVANCFPHKGYIWNYGCLPQTWEDPSHIDKHTKCKGDGDPIDVCEIGQKIQERGSVVPVKVLGCLAMIDEGETDWKVMVIDITDPLAEKINSLQDLEKYMPGYLAATIEWFRIYKMPDGKPANQFAFNDQFQEAETALKIIDETHDQWKNLMSNKEVGDSLNIERCSAIRIEKSDIYDVEKLKTEDFDSKYPIVESNSLGKDSKSSVESSSKWDFVKL